MSRVKRGVTSHAKHKKVYKAAKGSHGRRKNTIRAAKAAGRQGRPICVPRPQAQEAHLPRAVDPAHQRRGASVRHDLQRLHQRPFQVGHHRGPQGAVGSRHQRTGGVPGDRRKGQGRARGVSFDREVVDGRVISAKRVFALVVRAIHVYLAAAPVSYVDAPPTSRMHDGPWPAGRTSWPKECCP